MAAPLSLPAALVAALRDAQRVAVLTGAGISAESGLPTFRDRLTGLWERYDLEDLVTTEALLRHPDVVWDWFADLRDAMERAAPNAAHRALVTIEQHVAQFTLATQNIDGLHQRAGSRNVHELHGNIFQVYSMGDGLPLTAAEWREHAPYCPRTGAFIRPAVVLFGEMLPETAWNTAAMAAVTCDLFLSIGTSGIVEPAASLTEYAARNGATVAVINLDVTPASRGRVHWVNGKAGTVLPALVHAAYGAAADMV